MPDDLRDQFPKVREVVKALRIPVYEMPGYEADDVIGTITQQLDSRDDLETTIVTVDLDMLQLVTPRVRLMTTRSGVENTVMYDVAKIDERFGLRPDQMIDYKALKGDPTDNIPGVPGVGEKTAAKLIREFGDLDALLARLDEVTPAKLGDKLARARRPDPRWASDLSTIVRDLPIQIDLEAARLGDYDRDTVVRLFREYEFRTLIERLPPMAGESRRAADREPAVRGRERLRAGGARRRPARGLGPGALRRPARERRAPAPARLRRGGAAGRRAAGGAGATDGDGGRRRRAGALEPAEDLPTALAAAIVDPGRIEVRGADRIADLEPLARGPARGRRRRSLPTIRGRAAARRSRSPSPGRTAGSSPPTAPRPPDALRHLLERLGTPLVGHEVKPVLVAAFAEDPTRPPLPVAFDTQIAAYILNAALRSQTIADVVAENLDQILPPATELPATARAGLEALSAHRRPRAARATARRGRARAALPRGRAAARSRSSPGWRPSASPSTSRRWPCSTASSRPRSPASSRRSTSTSGTSSTSAARSSSSRSCSSSSNLPKGKRTKTGYSTDASVLEDLRPAHPMIDKLLEWRVYTKLRSTYVEALPSLMAADGRLHTTFHQAVAATGRLSSSDPNLQNIPIRTALGRRIRRAFVAGEPALVAARRRLLADRAADPRPRLGRRAPQGRLRAAGRHPPRDRRPGAPQGPGRHHPRTSGRWRRWSTSGWPTG